MNWIKDILADAKAIVAAPITNVVCANEILS